MRLCISFTTGKVEEVGTLCYKDIKILNDREFCLLPQSKILADTLDYYMPYSPVFFLITAEILVESNEILISKKLLLHRLNTVHTYMKEKVKQISKQSN